jgi:hypothetical protein
MMQVLTSCQSLDQTCLIVRLQGVERWGELVLWPMVDCIEIHWSIVAF